MSLFKYLDDYCQRKLGIKEERGMNIDEIMCMLQAYEDGKVIVTTNKKGDVITEYCNTDMYTTDLSVCNNLRAIIKDISDGYSVKIKKDVKPKDLTDAEIEHLCSTLATIISIKANYGDESKIEVSIHNKLRGNV